MYKGGHVSTKSAEYTVKLLTEVDLVSIGSMLVTSLIVIATTVITIKNFRSAFRHQEEVELKKVKLQLNVENRQKWIELLRVKISEYCSEVSSIRIESVAIQKKLELAAALASRSHEENGTGMAETAVTQAVSISHNFQLKIMKCDALRHEIVLLLDQNDDVSKELVVEVNSLYEQVIGSTRGIGDELRNKSCKKEIARITELTQFLIAQTIESLGLENIHNKQFK